MNFKNIAWFIKAIIIIIIIIIIIDLYCANIKPQGHYIVLATVLSEFINFFTFSSLIDIDFIVFRSKFNYLNYETLFLVEKIGGPNGDLKWGPEGGPNGGSKRVQRGSRRGSEGGPGGDHD